MNNYINNARLNWGILVCGFWIRIMRIATTVAEFTIRKSTERTRKNIELVKAQLTEEQLQQLAEIDEMMGKL